MQQSHYENPVEIYAIFMSFWTFSSTFWNFVIAHNGVVAAVDAAVYICCLYTKDFTMSSFMSQVMEPGGGVLLLPVRFCSFLEREMNRCRRWPPNFVLSKGF